MSDTQIVRGFIKQHQNLALVVVRGCLFGFTQANNNKQLQKSLRELSSEQGEEWELGVVRPLLVYIYTHLNPACLGHPLGPNGPESIEHLMTKQLDNAHKKMKERANDSGAWSVDCVLPLVQKTGDIVPGICSGLHFPALRLFMKVCLHYNSDLLFLTDEQKKMLEDSRDTMDNAGFVKRQGAQHPRSSSRNS